MVVFCTLHYICSYVQIVPQIIKLLKTKSSHDYSLWQVALGFVGMICWAVYIFTSSFDIVLYVGTILELVLLIIIDILILCYYPQKKFNNSRRKDY